MQELQLHLHGAYKGNCKMPGETLTASQRYISLLFYKLAYDGKIIIHSTTYMLSESLFYIQ